MSTPSPSNLPNEQATPRTDAHETEISQKVIFKGQWDNRVVSSRLSRELETELTAAQAQIAKLTEERDELRVQMNAWHDQFGTTQLTHAVARLESSERQTAALRAQVADLTRSLEAKPICDALRKELKKVSAGEPHTWGFVALFMGIIDSVEKQFQGRSTQPAQSTAQGTEGTIRAQPTRGALERQLRQIIGTIEAHEIESCQCDGREEEHCNCLRKEVKKAKLLLPNVATSSKEPEEIHRITETNQPTFPCWVYTYGDEEIQPGWWKAKEFSHIKICYEKFTHFCTSEDRPTATPPESKEGGL